MDDTENQSGSWIGKVRGIRVREPGPDADGPILEMIGEEGVAAMEFDDESFIDGLSHTAAELQMVFDEIPEDTETDSNEQ